MILGMIQNPYTPGWPELRPFVAEICLLATLIAVLLVPFFTRKANVACALVTLLGIGIALLSLLAVNGRYSPDGEFFRGLLVSDHVAVFWKALLLTFVGFIVLMWFCTTGPAMHEGDGPEFFTLLLGATIGMCLMSSTTNLLLVVIAIEMSSLPSYVLAGFRKTDRIGAEASLKYVLFGAATSSVMIYGMSMLYGLFGTLSVPGIAQQIAAGHGATSPLLALGILGLIVGIGFKLSAVPLHFWCPDVFEGAGTDVAAFLSVASKGAAMVLLLRLLGSFSAALQSMPTPPLPAIAVVIGVIGAITATVGNTAAFVQNNVKRLLAYSSIAHAGYMICGLSLLYSHNRESNALASDVAQAILLYLAVYLFMNLGAFTVVGLLERQAGGVTLDHFAALGRRSPYLAVCMAACLFSLVGLPPFGGFVAKLNLMYVLGGNGGWWWTLVAVIGLNTIFSLYYYARVVKVMYLTPSERPNFAVSSVGLGIAAMCAIALLLMLLGFNTLLKATAAYGHLRVANSSSVTSIVPVEPAVAGLHAPAK